MRKSDVDPIPEQLPFSAADSNLEKVEALRLFISPSVVPALLPGDGRATDAGTQIFI